MVSDRELDQEFRVLRERLERMEADQRQMRTTLDQILIARSQGPGLAALFEEIEPSEEEKKREEDFKAFQAMMREVEEV